MNRVKEHLRWLRQRHEMRHEFTYRAKHEPNPSYVFHVHPGEHMTVFDYDGSPMYAEVLDIDRGGTATLLREDGVTIERLLH